MVYHHLFEDLTQEQRDDLRAEILAEELIKMLIEGEKEQNTNTVDEQE